MGKAPFLYMYNHLDELDEYGDLGREDMLVNSF